MISIGVIVPSWHYFHNPFKLQPLNELYFATLINSKFKNFEVNVKVIDLREARLPTSDIHIEDIGLSIAEHDLFFYWITKTGDYNEIIDIVRRLRQIYPNAKHAAGGTHVDNLWKDCLNHFDLIIQGPGEESIIRIIKDIQNNTLKNIYSHDWRNSNFDEAPFPRREYLPEKSITNTELFTKYDGILGTSAMFSRGCAFNCAYCAYNVPKFLQRRSLTSIESELNYLKEKYQINGINLRDEICFPMSRKDSIPFIEMMGGMGLIWRGQTRIGIDREILSLASQSGCVELAFGVESASQQVLDLVNKGQNLAQIRETFSICRDVDIRTKMCLILGLPGEPENIVALTQSLLQKTRPDFVNISGFCPVPGSDIFNHFEKYGIKYIDKDWSKHAHLLFRFSDDEHFGLPFEFSESSPLGKSFSKNEILNNIIKLQHFAREQEMSY